MKTYYLAYGSNLHPVRLTQRVASAVPIAPVRIIGYRLVFNKRGRDGSAKCSLQAARVSRVSMWAALYEMDGADAELLDGHESLGRGYDKLVMPVHHAGVMLPAFTYRVAASHVTATTLPFVWYRDVVASGARYHGFPSQYVKAIADMPAIADPDDERSSFGRRLLAEAERYSMERPTGGSGTATAVVEWPLSSLG